MLNPGGTSEKQSKAQILGLFADRVDITTTCVIVIYIGITNQDSKQTYKIANQLDIYQDSYYLVYEYLPSFKQY